MFDAPGADATNGRNPMRPGAVFTSKTKSSFRGDAGTEDADAERDIILVRACTAILTVELLTDCAAPGSSKDTWPLTVTGVIGVSRTPVRSSPFTVTMAAETPRPGGDACARSGRPWRIGAKDIFSRKTHHREHPRGTSGTADAAHPRAATAAGSVAEDAGADHRRA